MHDVTVKIKMPRQGQLPNSSGAHAFSTMGTGTCCPQRKPRHREVEGGARRLVLCPRKQGHQEAMPRTVVFQYKLRKSFLLSDQF